jgi:hypothetical protein
MELLTRWIRPKGLCRIKGHLAIHMFPGQRWRAAVYGALDAISVRVHEEMIHRLTE